MKQQKKAAATKAKPKARTKTAPKITIKSATIWCDNCLKTVKSRDFLITAVVAIIVLFTLGYLLRGWMRSTVIPDNVALFTGNQAKQAYNKQIKQSLQDPITSLGFKNITKESKDCTLFYAKGISTQVLCSYDINAYSLIPTSEEDKATLNDNAQRLQNQLLHLDWHGTYTDYSEYTSLTKLVSNLTKGIDYTPDAFYERSINGAHCYLDVNTAFAKPKAPAMAIQASCTKLYDVLGTPAHQYLD